jgi:hypothetical protein
MRYPPKKMGAIKTAHWVLMDMNRRKPLELQPILFSLYRRDPLICNVIEQFFRRNLSTVGRYLHQSKPKVLQSQENNMQHGRQRHHHIWFPSGSDLHLLLRGLPPTLSDSLARG